MRVSEKHSELTKFSNMKVLTIFELEVFLTVFTLIKIINLFDISYLINISHFSIHILKIFLNFFDQIWICWNKKRFFFFRKTTLKFFTSKLIQKLLSKKNFYSYLKFFMLLWLCFEFLCFSFILVLSLIWWLPVRFWL